MGLRIFGVFLVGILLGAVLTYQIGCKKCK